MKRLTVMMFCGLLLLMAPLGAQQQEKKLLQIAVYPFDAIGVDPNSALSITNAIFRELSKSEKLLVRDQQSTRAAIEQIGLAQSGHCSEDSCRVEAGKILKAEKLVMGTVEKLDVNYYTISMRVVEVQTGRTEYQDALDCPCSNVVQVRDIAVQMVNSTILVYLETGKKVQPQPATAGAGPTPASTPPQPTPAAPPPAAPTRPAHPPATPAKAGAQAKSDMLPVPAGEFMMGCNEAMDNECEDNEKPYHKVNLDAYYIDKYEVTAEQYEACVKAGKCSNPSTGGYCNWGVADRNNHPINCVDWHQARAYCEWAGKKLPTEAQWEKAARGVDGRKFPWGNQAASCEYTVMAERNKIGCGRQSTWPVGSRPKGASAYGAMDMAGNVWEWVADWYDEEYYKNAESRNPAGPSQGNINVVRGGGGWLVYSKELRSSRRIAVDPRRRRGVIGFRCAR